MCCFDIVPYSFVSVFLVCIGSSTLVPVGAAHNPNTLCTRLTPLHVSQLFSPCRALLLLEPVCFDVLDDLHQYAFLMKSAILPNQNPQVGVHRSWANTPHFTSPQTINDPLIVNVHHRRTESYPEETNSASNVPYIPCEAPPRRDRAAPPTSGTRLICLRLPTESLRLACPTVVLFRIPPPHCQMASLGGCDLIPLCHFQSFFEILALYAHFSNLLGSGF